MVAAPPPHRTRVSFHTPLREAVGVVHLSGGCNDKNSVTKMSGTNGRRRYRIPFRIVPAFGKLSENGIHPPPPNKQRCHVFQEDVFWSYHANEPHEVEEQPASLTPDSFAPSGAADVLAWEARCPEVGLRDFFGLEGSDVIVSPNIRPMVLQHLHAIRLVFDLSYAFMSRPFQAQVDAADASKEANEAELHSTASA